MELPRSYWEKILIHNRLVADHNQRLADMTTLTWDQETHEKNAASRQAVVESLREANKLLEQALKDDERRTSLGNHGIVVK